MTRRVLRVGDVLEDRILVSRESARRLENALGALMTSAPSPGSAGEERQLVVDFDGVAGIAPSFLDELLSIFDSLVASGAKNGRCFIVANPPTRLSAKFEAIARGHGMSVELLPDGSWRLAAVRGSAG
jgi:hypothetical protein